MAQQAKLRIAIVGAGGRMGRALLDAIGAVPAVKVSSVLEHAGSPLLGLDASALSPNAAGLAISADLDAALANADVLIDFTRPEGTLRHIALCRQHGVNMVIGTTGFSTDEKKLIETASTDIAIVFAPNMSVGVNVMLKLVALATSALHEQYDVEVIETHHSLKVDAPSGTALQLGEVAAQAIGKSLDEIAVFERHGNTGARKSGAIGFSAIRGGDIIGDHTVMFAGTGERIEISHKSTSRTNYAQGAMRAAIFLADKKAGLYGMDDVLGLK
ncbi:MAG: 4-hydroxy-tetrahydrodipicolinate reductase [Burkholderiales bacterium]|nr:4-hydroxy-tetrahydrodipicolinate reductase [Burkholderiales bacterium]